MKRRLLLFITSIVVICAVATIGRAANVLTEVPSDALGFVLVRNLSSADTKVSQLATLLQRNVPRPLQFLKDFAGISEGINPNGDFLLALFPSANGEDGRLVFCIWLPVSDYDRFLASFGATSIDGVAAATIAGEDLLIARRGEWALIMDPDQHDRITQLAAAQADPPPMPDWTKWVESNDMTVVAFAAGVRTLAASMTENEPSSQGQSGFGDRNALPPYPNANRRVYISARRYLTLTDILENVRTEFKKWSIAMPELADAMNHANLVGCGLRIDDGGNTRASVRVALDKAATSSLAATEGTGKDNLPPTLYSGSTFVSSGAGMLAQPVLAAYTRGYIRYLAEDMKNEERTMLDEATLKRLMGAGEEAAALVRAIHFVNQPGAETEPVYSNNFVALRVASADKFVGHAKEVMRLWNTANRNAKGDAKLIFEVEETKIGETPAALYLLDMVEISGGMVLPEIRQQMEKMFGPEGKLRIWIVPTDETTVVLAMATPDQIGALLKVISKNESIDWNRDGLREINALLPEASDWRLFFDPHRYLDWQRREQAAMVGVPIIGGTLVRDFPVAPPVGIAGSVHDGELRFEAAALAPTVKSADMYLARNRSRAAIQFRARVLAPAPAPAPAPQK